MADASDFAFYNGSVEDAIKKVKEQKTCLLVFVYGDDEISKKYNGYFSSSGKLAQVASKFVCMRLDAQSDTALQFSAFYPVVSLPTVYLISADGVSLEALIGDRTEEDLVQRISASAPQSAATATAAAEVAPDWDDRVERMEQKMAAKQEEKRREAAERERQAELERRSAGRSLGQLRQQQMLEEEKARAEEVRQERQARLRGKQQQSEQPRPAESQPESAEDAGLRDLRAAQSAAYHEERRAADAAAAAATTAKETAERAATAAADAERRKTARLQVRCPDGRVLLRELPSEATLAQLRDSLAADLGPAPFRLATVYPRQVLDFATESAQTLAELELAPSASLLLLPAASVDGGGGQGGGGGALSLLAMPFALLGRLLTFLLALLGGLFGGGGGGANTAPEPSSRSSTTARGGARSGGGGGATIQRSGNTARLRNIPSSGGRGGGGGGGGGGSGSGNQDDDDDDNATWNGNSTQQM